MTATPALRAAESGAKYTAPPTRFVPTKDAVRFQTEWVDRRVARLDPVTQDLRGEKRHLHQRPNDLAQEIADEATRMQHSDAQRWLSTWAIAVRDRDGMTWTAGKIAQVLSATLDGTWTLAYAQGSKEANPDPVAELSALVGGQKVLLQAAKRSRLTTGGSNPWLWAIPV